MKHLKDKNKYSIVSLGFFCSVALENERIGLRDCSLPFDWLITSDFEKVLWLIENEFKDFMLEDNLYQEYDINPNYYYDKKNKVHFYHDFVCSESLRNQYSAVYKKYKRRIIRFYEIISKPTIFIRYCSEGEKEVNYIRNNRTKILNILKKYNPDNKLIIIYTGAINNIENDYTFCVEADNNDTVARVYLKKIPELQHILLDNSNLTKKQILNNIKKVKIKKIISLYKRFIKQIQKYFYRTSKVIYYHNKQYSNLQKEV
jgi:hypothetical protein